MQILHPFAGAIQRHSEELSDPDRRQPDHCPQCEAHHPLRAHGFYTRTLPRTLDFSVVLLSGYLDALEERHLSGSAQEFVEAPVLRPFWKVAFLATVGEAWRVERAWALAETVNYRLLSESAIDPSETGAGRLRPYYPHRNEGHQSPCTEVRQPRAATDDESSTGPPRGQALAAHPHPSGPGKSGIEWRTLQVRPPCSPDGKPSQGVQTRSSQAVRHWCRGKAPMSHQPVVGPTAQLA